MLWPKDQKYLREKATAENLNAIAGLPVMPDDMLLLIAGYGLNFPEWEAKSARQSGYKLHRSNFDADLAMQTQLSRIDLISNFSPALTIRYQEYKMHDSRALPSRIPWS